MNPAMVLCNQMGQGVPSGETNMYVILRNGKLFDERLTFTTIQEAINAIRILEANLDRRFEHSPYTISTSDAN